MNEEAYKIKCAVCNKELTIKEVNFYQANAYCNEHLSPAGKEAIKDTYKMMGLLSENKDKEQKTLF